MDVRQHLTINIVIQLLRGKVQSGRQMEAGSATWNPLPCGTWGNTLPREEGSSIPAAMVESTEEFIKDCERLIDTYHDASPYSMSQIVVSPCQPINCYKDTFVESVKLARDKRGSPSHTFRRRRK